MATMLGYMDDLEKSFYIEEFAFDTVLNRCDFLLESINRKMTLDMADAEYSVMTESCDYDDLDGKYAAIVEDGEQKKKGVISSVFDAIIKFINNIVEKIKGVFTKDVEKTAEEHKNEQVQVTEDPKGILNKLKAQFSKIKGESKNPSASSGEKTKLDIKTKIAIGAGAIVTVGTLFNVYKGVSGLMSEQKEFASQKKKEMLAEQENILNNSTDAKAILKAENILNKEKDRQNKAAIKQAEKELKDSKRSEKVAEKMQKAENAYQQKYAAANDKQRAMMDKQTKIGQELSDLAKMTGGLLQSVTMTILKACGTPSMAVANAEAAAGRAAVGAGKKIGSKFSKKGNTEQNKEDDGADGEEETVPESADDSIFGLSLDDDYMTESTDASEILAMIDAL